MNDSCRQREKQHHMYQHYNRIHKAQGEVNDEERNQYECGCEGSAENFVFPGKFLGQREPPDSYCQVDKPCYGA